MNRSVKISRLAQLGPVFRWNEAQSVGLADMALRDLREQGKIERLSHGLYRKAEAELANLELMVVAASHRDATICLTSALARHGLTDQIPSRIDIAVPRGTRIPRVSAPVSWHRFTSETFNLGRDTLLLDGGFTVGLYSPERSIVDVYRLRHLQGAELGREALKAWLRMHGSQPSHLLKIAHPFPQAFAKLRADLEVLL